MKLALVVTLFCQIAFAGDIVEEKFIIGSSQYTVEIMSNLSYPFLQVEADQLLLITHNSTYWDSQKITWSGTEKLVRHFEQKKTPFYYLADIQDRTQLKQQNYFPPGIADNNIYPYQGDSHRIVMHGTKAVIAGGNFTICACQTVRSLIGLAQQESKTLEVYYATDAIYEGRIGGAITLEQLIAGMSDAEFINYLKAEYFNEDTLPCVESFFKVHNRSFNYQIFRNGKAIADLGAGKTQVKLYFFTSENVIQNLKN